MFKSLFYIQILLFLIACNSDDSTPCFDVSNPECDNYDPCFYTNETSAEFEIGEQVSPIPPFHTMYIEDSIVVAGELRFKANDTTAEYYKWYLGTEVIEGPDAFEVKREIRSLPFGTYFATLVVQKQVDSICHPLDEGVDSVYKNFNKVGICSLNVANKFIGVFDHQDSDSIIIELGFFDSNIMPECGVDGRLHTINFYGEKDTVPVSFSTAGILNSKVIWNGSGSGTNLKGELGINGNNVSANYTYRNIDYNFNGVILK